MSNPRNRNGAARRGVSARLRAEGRPCWICVAAGKVGTIDYTLKFPHPFSFVVDELVPVSKYWLGGYETAQACALDYKNLAAAHKCCNEWRGNKTVDEVLAILGERRTGNLKRGRQPPMACEPHTSRDWTNGTRRDS